MVTLTADKEVMVMQAIENKVDSIISEYEDLIRNRIEEILLSKSFDFYIFRCKDMLHDDSAAIKIIENAVEDNKQIIIDRVKSHLKTCSIRIPGI